MAIVCLLEASVLQTVIYAKLCRMHIRRSNTIHINGFLALVTIIQEVKTMDGDIKVELLRNQIGAQKYGDCISCGKGSSEDREMICIKFGESRQCAMRICLCQECKNKLKNTL